MDRSRSKRYYYDQDYDSDNLPRTKQRYNQHSNHHYAPQSNHHRRLASGGGGGGGSGRKMQDPSLMVTTTYRILCHDVKAGGVIGKSGSIIKAIRQHTGAWINVHELMQGDEERIIEISDTRRRDPEGRMPSFSPAQEALFLIHERILESDAAFNAGFGGSGGGGGGSGDDEEEYGMRSGAGGGSNRVVTRLVVSRMHVGSLLGKGGKIIEQMRIETKTHIRILPRDHTLPRCVAMSEEIVQVTGEMNSVKNAIAIISSRLRESQHRDRSHFHGRAHSPERFFPPNDDFVPPMNNLGRRASVDGPNFGSRLSGGFNSSRGNSNSSRTSGYSMESGGGPFTDNAQLIAGELLVFRILCPVDKVDTIIGEPDGIIELLQNDIGVEVEITDPVAGSDEHIIIISSDEGPDDELFPAQEALLHIQTAIVDLLPEKENIVTTRLVVQSDEVGCLGGRDGALSDIQKMSGADVHILPKEELPSCLPDTDEIVQIVGEIKAAREALIEVTTRLRSYTYRELFQKETPPPISAPSPMGNLSGAETASLNNNSLSQENHTVTDPAASIHQNGPNIPTPHSLKDAGAPVSEIAKQNDSERLKDMPSGLNRYRSVFLFNWCVA
nr:RNA-binding KH domain-containing protein RCF3 [Ipomoea batatas]